MLTALTQHVTDSSLFYFFGDHINNFSASLFTILQTQTYETEKFLLEAHIIGQSHFFTLTDKPSQKIILVEALACIPLKHVMPSFSHSFAQAPSTSTSFDLTEYNISITSSAHILSSSEISKKNWKSLDAASKIFMEYSFPGKLSPKTIFSLQHNKNSLIVETLHEFEEGDLLIPLQTETKITIT